MRRPLGAFLLSLMASVAAAQAVAADIEVKGAWIRTPPNGAATAASYAVIVNRGIATDRLTGASTPAAATVELHQTTMGNGMARMRAMNAGLAVAGSSSVTLRPGGYHLMLTGLKHPLRPGEHVPMALHFQRAGDVRADFAVRDSAP